MRFCPFPSKFVCQEQKERAKVKQCRFLSSLQRLELKHLAAEWEHHLNLGQVCLQRTQLKQTGETLPRPTVDNTDLHVPLDSFIGVKCLEKEQRITASGGSICKTYNQLGKESESYGQSLFKLWIRMNNLGCWFFLFPLRHSVIFTFVTAYFCEMGALT